MYAGYGFEYPVICWNGTVWQHCQVAGVRKDESAVRLSNREAERCFPGAAMVTRPKDVPDWLDVSIEEAIRLRPDIFDDYDSSNLRKAPDEGRQYFEQVMPEHIKAMIAARKLDKDEG